NAKRDISSVLLLISLLQIDRLRSASEAVRAAKLLRARYAKYAGRNDLDTWQHPGDPLFLHRLGTHVHLRSRTRAVHRERNVTQPDQHARFQKLRGAESRQRKIRNGGVDILLRPHV